MGFLDFLDFNNDGEVDCGEMALGFSIFADREKDDALDSSGLDRYELELMDEDERREALEDAGLDPDEYDF